MAMNATERMLKGRQAFMEEKGHYWGRPKNGLYDAPNSRRLDRQVICPDCGREYDMYRSEQHKEWHERVIDNQRIPGATIREKVCWLDRRTEQEKQNKEELKCLRKGAGLLREARLLLRPPAQPSQPVASARGATSRTS